ncbi:MAG: M48 family metallopeptidase [Candidatus Margulisiibacteriota bacterium]
MNYRLIRSKRCSIALKKARQQQQMVRAIRQNALSADHYKRQARQLIPSRVAELSALTGLECSGVRVTSGLKRFGSCSPKNKLTISWRLLLAPEDVLDYVIIHELAHTVEKNHSRRFWNKVNELMPDYKPAHGWLKMNGAVLNI